MHIRKNNYMPKRGSSFAFEGPKVKSPGGCSSKHPRGSMVTHEMHFQLKWNNRGGGDQTLANSLEDFSGGSIREEFTPRGVHCV